MTDLKQQVREAVESLRKAAIDMYRVGDDKGKVLNIAADLEAAASAEPEYEVRWTWGKGIQTFDSEREARSFVREWRHNQEHTVRRVFIEPVPAKPEPELSVEEAARKVVEYFDRPACGDYGGHQGPIEDLRRALAREQKGAA